MPITVGNGTSNKNLTVHCNVTVLGIVRKRFMPLKFSEVLQGFKPGSDASVLNEKDSKVNKVQHESRIREWLDLACDFVTIF